MKRPRRGAHARTTDDPARCTRRARRRSTSPVPGMAEREPLHIAVVIPPFDAAAAATPRSSSCVDRLERAGHTCSIWLHDPLGRHHARERGRRCAAGSSSEFVPAAGARVQGLRRLVRRGRRARHRLGDRLPGAAPAALPRARLPGPGPRARVLRDLGRGALGGAHLRAGPLRHRGGPLAARPARAPLRQRGGWFRLGVDHERLPPAGRSSAGATRSSSTRASVTPRRAVPLGAARAAGAAPAPAGRRASCCSATTSRSTLPFDYEHLGVAAPEELARLYSEATVGLCLSLTNYSLIPQEMLACGLPCVDLAGGSTEAELGRDGGIELAEPDPVAHRRRDRAPARRSRPVGAALPQRARPGQRRRRGTTRRGRSSAACARRSASASATGTPRPRS